MPFRSVNHILGSIENQETWQGRRQFQQLVACWGQVVGVAVAAQTRPLSIQRQVLQVAASSSVWAQNLAFERRRILAKLNAQLPLSLTDIRFSTAQWQSQPLEDPQMDAAVIWRDHPSRVGQSPTQAKWTSLKMDTPEAAFQGWAEMVQQRSHHLPLCPTCRCPTPPGELERWSTCSLCAAKRW
jgi:predicted nucleic acid-binding Zn ribbon protein